MFSISLKKSKLRSDIRLISLFHFVREKTFVFSYIILKDRFISKHLIFINVLVCTYVQHITTQFFSFFFTVDLADIEGFVYSKAVIFTSEISVNEVKTVIHRLALDKALELNDIINRVLREAAK